MGVDLSHESRLWAAGHRVVIGIDEVGRGALAGPVSVGACALAACDTWPHGLADSKELTPARREALVAPLQDFGIARAVGHASPAEIDEHGIVKALRLAGLRALSAIAERGVVADAILLDGKHDWLSERDDLFGASSMTTPPVSMVIGGDRLCASIAAASVVAKVERDALMVALSAEHPPYGWAGNKGYGAAEHLEAIAVHGATEHHRRSWNLTGGAPLASEGPSGQ